MEYFDGLLRVSLISGVTRFLCFIYFEQLSLKMGGRFVYLVVDIINLSQHHPLALRNYTTSVCRPSTNIEGRQECLSSFQVLNVENFN